MRHFRKILFGMCGLLLFFSCTTDQHENPISDLISINIQSPKVNYITKAVTSTPQEDNIDHIDILIFDKNGNIVPTFGKQRFTGSEITGGKVSLRTDKTISPQHFYAVANADASSITNISTLAQLKALQLTNTAGLTSPFKMVGQHEGVDVTIPSPNIDIQLQRTMARIDIKLIPSISNFELINAEIRNTRNTTFLFPNSATGSLIDIKTPIQADDTKNHTAKLYSFENNNTNLNDIANTTCVIIAGYYNGDKSKLTYYRLDVLTSDNKAKVDKGVCYTLTVTDILGKGWDTADDAEANKAENLIYKVDHWVEDNSNIVFDGENYISLAERKLNVIKAGGNIIIGLNASDISKVTTENNGDITINSITINPSSKNATINIGQNNTGHSLSGNIIFKLGRLSYTLPIYQYAQDHLISLPNKIEFEDQGGVTLFTPRLSSGWKLTSVSEISNTDIVNAWLNVDANYSSYEVKILAKPSSIARSAVLQCYFIHEDTQEQKTETVQVLQKSNRFYISATTNTNNFLISGTGEYRNGDNCTLTAPSIPGQTFSHWEENGINVSSDIRYQFSVSNHRTLIAIYSPLMTLLTLQVQGNGIATGGGRYSVGSSVEINAVSSSGSAFLGWFQNGVKVYTNNKEVIKISESDRTLVAQFSLSALNITLLNNLNHGTVTGSGAYPMGSNATISATARPGYKFSYWEENGINISSANPHSFTVTKDRTISAIFSGHILVSVTAKTSPDLGRITFAVSSNVPVRDNITLQVRYRYRIVGGDYTETTSNLYLSSGQQYSESRHDPGAKFTGFSITSKQINNPTGASGTYYELQ